jgi:hypothetical protein
MAKDAGSAIDTLYFAMLGLVTAGDEASKVANKAIVDAKREEYQKSLDSLHAVSKEEAYKAALAHLETAFATVEQGHAGDDVAQSVEQNVQEAAATATATTQMSSTTNEIARTVADLAMVADTL